MRRASQRGAYAIAGLVFGAIAVVVVLALVVSLLLPTAVLRGMSKVIVIGAVLVGWLASYVHYFYLPVHGRGGFRLA